MFPLGLAASMLSLAASIRSNGDSNEHTFSHLEKVHPCSNERNHHRPHGLRAMAYVRQRSGTAGRPSVLGVSFLEMYDLGRC